MNQIKTHFYWRQKGSALSMLFSSIEAYKVNRKRKNKSYEGRKNKRRIISKRNQIQ